MEDSIHFQRRLHEEMEAAIEAKSIAATLAHIALATAYARLLRSSDSGQL